MLQIQVLIYILLLYTTSWFQVVLFGTDSSSHCNLSFLSRSSSFTICQCSIERLFSPKLEAIICAMVSHLQKRKGSQLKQTTTSTGWHELYVHKPAKFRTAQAPIIVHGTDHFILNHLQLQCKHCVTQRTCHAKRFILDLSNTHPCNNVQGSLDS
jgi:hypothetical protein